MNSERKEKDAVSLHGSMDCLFYTCCGQTSQNNFSESSANNNNNSSREKKSRIIQIRCRKINEQASAKALYRGHK